MADVATSSNDTSPTLQEEGDNRLQGRVKWFNNRAGFGFLTVLTGLNTNKDVFVHHSNINVSAEQYKYLIEGEYVNFTLSKSDSTEHPFQASNVRGIEDGPLMCETRYASRSNNDRARTRPRPRGGVRD